MTARTRSAVTPLLLVLLVALLAYAISLIPTLGVAHGATAASSPPPAVEDVAELWRRGDSLGAGVLALFGLLAIALRADRRRAFYYTAGLTALGGCVDLIANGNTPNASMLLGSAVAFIALVTRSPLPPRDPPQG